MREFLTATFLTALLLGGGTGCAVSGPSKVQVTKATSPVDRFLEEHDEFGEPVSRSYVAPWAKGERERVEFQNGRSLLFYMKGGDVVTVYEDGSEGRKLVWGAGERDVIPKAELRPALPGLPPYKVTRVKQTGGTYGDVIVPSLSRNAKASECERIARAIAAKEGLSELALYSTEEAMKANLSASYSKSHPGVLEKGFLGSLSNGKFTPGEAIFPG